MQGEEKYRWRRDERVGVTIITGFLGSGKSTLIRRILTEEHGMRLVVVENEFGANSKVEEAIVTQGVGSGALEEFIELPNGCICCAAQDDLTDSLTRLVQKRGKDIDHILIEASGLADPGPIAASFWVDEELETGLVLDCVVNVVDAVNVEKYLCDGGGKSEKARITQKQLAVADLILLNKVDLVGSEGVDRVCKVIRDAGSGVEIIETVRCQVELREILGIGAYEERNSEREIMRKREIELNSGHVHGVQLGVGSVTVSFTDVKFDARAVDRVLGGLLWEEDETSEVWRMKALVVIEGEEFKQVYQSVDTLFDHSGSSVPARSDKDCSSTFIFIGRNLAENYLRKSLAQATVASC